MQGVRQRRENAGDTFNIRSTLIDGEPWFVAADVCRALGADVAHGAPNWLRSLDADEKRVVRRTELPDLMSGSKAPSLTLVTEPGLYALLGRSDRPEAKPFRRWVNHEVLPSIRKTGSSALAEHGTTEMPLPAEFTQAIREMTQAQIALGERVATAMEELPTLVGKRGWLGRSPARVAGAAVLPTTWHKK